MLIRVYRDKWRMWVIMSLFLLNWVFHYNNDFLNLKFLQLNFPEKFWVNPAKLTVWYNDWYSHKYINDLGLKINLTDTDQGKNNVCWEIMANCQSKNHRNINLYMNFAQIWLIFSYYRKTGNWWCYPITHYAMRQNTGDIQAFYKNWT